MSNGEFVSSPAVVKENFIQAPYLNRIKKLAKGATLKMLRFLTMFLMLKGHPFLENGPKVMEKRIVDARHG